MKHSTAPMNREEQAYRDRCVALGCVACHLWEGTGRGGPLFTGYCGHVEFDHFKSGNIRVGHFWGVALGYWHHQRAPLAMFTHADMAREFGPSKACGSSLFTRTYGSWAELLAFQDELLRRAGFAPPQRPENRRWSHAA